MAHLWTLTLEKQGCGTMLKAGADGVLEAIVLSIGALKFTNDHLEFGKNNNGHLQSLVRTIKMITTTI